MDLRLLLVLLFRATDLVIQYLRVFGLNRYLKMSVSVGLRRSLEGILVVFSSIHRLRGKIYYPSQSKLSAWIDEAKYISHVFPMDSFRQ